ncbi:MAG: SpoIIE family protein phosphatase [Myxococcota bacterium]
MRVLVADDDPIQRDRLKIALEGWGYDVVCAPNGRAAWETLRNDDTFSILVTDWLMPELDGTELCRLVRESPRSRYLPILLLTSRTRQEDLIEGLNAGADAFITKPCDPPLLLAQIRIAERILELEERLATQVGELRSVNQRLETDLASAAEVQLSLLPERAPRINGVDFAWVYEACDRLGGDMFNVFTLDDRHVGMYVLDVSGHGTPAALQSVTLSHVLAPFDVPGAVLKRGNRGRERYSVAPPAEVARKLNAQFPLIERSGQFFTFLYGVLDVKTLVVRYVCAGHPGPIVSSKGRVRYLEKGDGIPVGITNDAIYDEQQVQLQAGDQLVFYTDGVLETMSASGEAFGLDRLVGALSQRVPIRENLSRLHERLEQFGRGEPRHDDVTIVGLEVG